VTESDAAAEPLSLHRRAVAAAVTGWLGAHRTAVAAGTWAALAALVAVLAYGAVSTDGFLTVANGKAILASVGVVGIVAVGMTFVMLGGNLFSLSLGTTLAVSAIAFLDFLHLGVAAAAVLAAAIGAAVSGAQGVAVGAFGVNPIVVTIGAGALQEGVVVKLTGGRTIVPSAPLSSYRFLVTPLLGLPFPVYVLAGVALSAELVLRYTTFGRELYLVGENRRAARAAGLRVAGVTTAAFAVAGLCAGVAGILSGSYNQGASLTLSGTYTYDAISAAIVGGNAITGGRGSVGRTLFGAIVMATLSDLMLLRHYGTGAQILVKGVIVLVFVSLLNARRGGSDG